MFHILLNTILIFGLYSCSSINQSSQEYVQLKNELRHGLLPIDVSDIKESEEPLSMKSIKRGEKLYQVNCYSCHGADGSGNGPKAKELGLYPRDLREVTKAVPNFKFYMMVSQWEGEMPGWVDKLDDSELKDLESFIKHMTTDKG